MQRPEAQREDRKRHAHESPGPEGHDGQTAGATDPLQPSGRPAQPGAEAGRGEGPMEHRVDVRCFLRGLQLFEQLFPLLFVVERLLDGGLRAGYGVVRTARAPADTAPARTR